MFNACFNFFGQMSGRGNSDRGKAKMPVIRGRGRLVRPGDLQLHTNHIRRQHRTVGSSSTQLPPSASSAQPPQAAISAPQPMAPADDDGGSVSMMPTPEYQQQQSPQPSQVPIDQDQTVMDEGHDPIDDLVKEEEAQPPPHHLLGKSNETIETDESEKVILRPYGRGSVTTS